MILEVPMHASSSSRIAGIERDTQNSLPQIASIDKTYKGYTNAD